MSPSELDSAITLIVFKNLRGDFRPHELVAQIMEVVKPLVEELEGLKRDLNNERMMEEGL